MSSKQKAAKHYLDHIAFRIVSVGKKKREDESLVAKQPVNLGKSPLCCSCNHIVISSVRGWVLFYFPI